MQKLLAISGGVDSVCLLHMYKDDPEVVVAHFNHGTRPSADDDEKFVKQLAKEYGKKCVIGRADLGVNVSEEKARKARYDFLEDAARKNHYADIFTAHHLDDLVETIAINLLRGTGWRGLAPFSNGRIRRPFFGCFGHGPGGQSTADFVNDRHIEAMTKKDLLKYAAKNHLTFREDPTNHEDNYLRNRVRENLIHFPKEKKLKLAEYFDYQTYDRQTIEMAARDALMELEMDSDTEYGVYLRDWFDLADRPTELELLRAAIDDHGLSLTRPQLEDFLDAIQTYASGKAFNLPKDHLVHFSKDAFMLPA